MNSKRGISAIVATVLIILITIAGVTILWVAIIPLITQGATFNDANARLDVVTSGGYTVYDKVNRIAIVQVKRYSDESDMKYVRITLNFVGTSYSAVVDAPSPNQVKSYKFNLSVGNYADPQSVQVSPIFVTGTKEREGVITSKADILTGTLSTIPPAYELLNLTGDYRGVSSRCTSVTDCVPGACQHTPVCNPDGSCSYGAVTSCANSDGCCPTGCTSTNDNDCSAGCTPSCPSPSTIPCGQALGADGCGGTCTGTGTYCASGTSCNGVSCVAILPACTDADLDGYCAQASGACTGTSVCTAGYSDCNNSNIQEYIQYPANTYHFDVDGDGYGGGQHLLRLLFVLMLLTLGRLAMEVIVTMQQLLLILLQ